MSIAPRHPIRNFKLGRLLTRALVSR